MKDRLLIVKVGGNIIDDSSRLDSLLHAFSKIDGSKILVHGGGKTATEFADKLGVRSKYVDGRRITDKETLDIVTMVYAGGVNKNIVARLQSYGCNAMGLTGADANTILAQKRPVKDIDYGFVGDVNAEGVNVAVYQGLLNMGISLVLAPLTHDGKENMLNTNADTIAQEVAKAMSHNMHVNLIYCFEKKGLLMDADDDTTLIDRVDKNAYARLKEEGLVYGGMIPKLDNAFEAIDHGVEQVVIGSADELTDLIEGRSGTKIEK